MTGDLRVAAVQLEPVVGDVEANLDRAERLARRAADEGAEVIVLPEFFTTGMAFLAQVGGGALPEDGAATEMITRVASDKRVMVGGSFLCRGSDGDVRNAFLLAGPDGLIGRHDKDLPTMWENYFYAGGDDPGVIEAPGGLRIGVALCWELMRAQTVHRLRGRVDLVLAGSGWWSIPQWRPRAVLRRWEAANRERARRSVLDFAALVGAPVVHASLCGPITCPLPGMPGRYRGEYEGPSVICDRDGEVLAERPAQSGPGVTAATVPTGAANPSRDPAPGFWLRPRGPLPAFAWAYQGWLGRRAYRQWLGSPPAGNGPADDSEVERMTRARTNETLVLSGLVELAAGAVTGWPYALAIADAERARRIGIRSTPRLRQWHLDLIALGALSLLVGAAVPELPRRVAWPLAAGCWTNANAFGLLAFRPEAAETPAYRIAVAASFTTVSWGFVSLAALALRRRWRMDR
ncbi:carbon-nitrogen hydrolase family protein [Mycobacterium sp. WUMAC-067]|uniref:carbon-nitrogen hydrolase family protein n=1 Tax=unclassified Mycobacterium TaxID=2642494 RepID=UPI001CD9C13E|nr:MULTISPECIES: carbon-nitrogen hydrolase family protein [unclassified Mycobacterium]MCA2245057.1 carbon-nitrogen hydrolase family protein [Mycobacterium sp. WUMAC-067]MCA2316572.1 carbon-nitrogen hydrolase family protein [Mycobacterium sp. WUMAC-025]